jgi:hypothetical protein
MHDPAQQLIRTTLDDAHLLIFASRLHDWLIADLNQDAAAGTEFTESRAKALLRASDAIDAPSLRSFYKIVSGEIAPRAATIRVVLYDLLKDSGLAESEEIAALAVASAASESGEAQPDVSWLAVAMTAFAWRDDYPVQQLDPASPPEAFSPAGQLVKRTAHFLRKQIQRSATDRDKLGRRLAYLSGRASSGAQTLNDLQPSDPLAPLPPHFRPPIPVSYPEVSRETLQVDVDAPTGETTAVTLTDPIKVTEEDLPASETPQTMPPIRIRPEQAESRPSVVTPQRQPASPLSTSLDRPLPSFARAVRGKFGRSREPFTTTKLRVVVQEYADGPGQHGLQVRVTCQGVKSYVAGTTNRDGQFLCELPVRVRSGLTYDVDLTWPRDLGGEVERKSITLNADRTEFSLPFYLRVRRDEG